MHNLLKPVPVMALAILVLVVHVHIYLRDAMTSEEAKHILDAVVLALLIPWFFGLWRIGRKCGARHPTGIICTRLRKHSGKHLGHVQRIEAQQWEDDPP